MFNVNLMWNHPHVLQIPSITALVFESLCSCFGFFFNPVKKCGMPFIRCFFARKNIVSDDIVHVTSPIYRMSLRVRRYFSRCPYELEADRTKYRAVSFQNERIPG